MATVSLCMIAKNEESVIAAALASAVNEVDEMIVLDTGSSDSTVDIAIDMGAHVYRTTWDDNFSSMRNECINYASGDYVLVLDADERILPGAKKRMKVFVENFADSLGRVLIHSAFIGADGSSRSSTHHVTRFFPRVDGIHYVGRVHEQLMDSCRERELRYLGVHLEHVGYNLSVEQLRVKSQRNLELLLMDISDHGISSYRSYQLGKVYASLDNLQAAIEYYEQSYRTGDPQATYYPELLISYLYALKELRRMEDMSAVLARGLTLYPDFPDLHFFAGKAFMEFGVSGLESIRQSFEVCLLLGEQDEKYPSVQGVGSYLAAYNLGVFYESVGDLKNAEAMYRKSATARFNPAVVAMRRLEECRSGCDNP